MTLTSRGIEVWMTVPSSFSVTKNCLSIRTCYVDATIPEITRRKGIVTSACVGSCWFKQGDKKPSIRTGSCCQVGHYCGHYVWVPECHRDELSKLTLVILDIALNDPPTKPSSNAQPVQVSFENQATASSDEGEKIAVESMSDQSETRGELPVQSLQRFKAKLFDVPPLPENEASKTPFDSGILLDRLRLNALTN